MCVFVNARDREREIENLCEWSEGNGEKMIIVKKLRNDEPQSR